MFPISQDPLPPSCNPSKFHRSHHQGRTPAHNAFAERQPLGCEVGIAWGWLKWTRHVLRDQRVATWKQITILTWDWVGLFLCVALDAHAWNHIIIEPAHSEKEWFKCGPSKKKHHITSWFGSGIIEKVWSMNGNLMLQLCCGHIVWVPPRLKQQPQGADWSPVLELLFGLAFVGPKWNVYMHTISTYKHLAHRLCACACACVHVHI